MNEQNSLKIKILIFFGALVIIILVILVALDQRQSRLTKKKNSNLNSAQLNRIPGVNISPKELAPSKSIIPPLSATASTLAKARKIAQGTSLITSNNIVVTPQGVPVKLNVMPSSPDAPQESAPLNAANIPDSTGEVKISVSNAGFVPATFTVKAGQLVNFILTSTDKYTHVWLLNDPALTAAALGVAGHETRAKSWNAPKKGIYKFHDDVIGHQGTVGTMIVD